MKIVRARYENGVLKPVNRVDLEEGKEYIITIGEDPEKLIFRYRGCLGKSSKEEFEELAEEAQL